MQMQAIRMVARDLGITPGRTTKRQLIRNIQLMEGNFPCFASATDLNCDQTLCLWRDDCFNSVKQGKTD